MEDTMNEKTDPENNIRSKYCRYQNGRLYFSRQVERRIFFGGTLIMLVWGLLEKIGIL